MKAMTCPQCGALIRKISLKDKFAECEYCEARILLEENRERIVDIPDRPAAEKKLAPPAPARAPLFGEQYEHPAPDNEGRAALSILAVLVVAVFGIIFAANSKSCRPRPVDEREIKTARATSFPTVQYSPPPSPTPPPAPRVDYQVKAQWEGDYDMEHFETPEINFDGLPATDPAALKKTLFKNRAVVVRININTDGEVTSAEAVSGHPVLKEAAVRAAKKTLFNSRPKPTRRLLTYYFHLKDE